MIGSPNKRIKRSQNSRAVKGAVVRAVIFACGIALFVFLGFAGGPYLHPSAAAAAPNRAPVAAGNIRDLP
jgi:hypothetical protein